MRVDCSFINRDQVQVLSYSKYSPSYQMVSLNAINMFMRILTDETLRVIQDKLVADPLLEEFTFIPIDNWMKMLTFCVETIFFRMRFDIYWQEEGLAMGLLFMKFFKEMALGSTSLNLSFRLRYVDNTFILWLHQEDV